MTKASKLPPKRGWAPGKYWCKCTECGECYYGAKKSWHCSVCAYK